MTSDFDKREWQEQQAERDAALEKQRARDEKAKERAARNAQRKLERLRKTLKDSGELTEWEDEFSESVTERLEKFGSAFADPEKGRPSDALSFAQKKVVSALNRKVKDRKKAGQVDADDKRSKPTGFKSKGGFKNKQTFQPRVRQIDDDLPEAGEAKDPYIPEYTPPPKPKRPFLRIVKNETD